MTLRVRLFGLVVVLLMGSLPLSVLAEPVDGGRQVVMRQTGPNAFAREPCPFELPADQVEGAGVDCGVLTVPEFRDDPDGRTISVANDSPATSLRLPRWRIPGSSGVVLRVEASDGFRSATATTGAVSLPNAAPGVAIVTPDDRSALAGPLVHLRALTLDAEDSDLGDLIAWSSSISGTLGRGNSVTARLVAGTHVLTAQVTDRAGASASASIRVTVAH